MYLVAIDFGTSNTVVCLKDSANPNPKTLEFDKISRYFGPVAVVPSLIFVETADQLLIGEEARIAKKTGQVQRFFNAFKRDLAAKYRPPDRQIEEKTFTLETVAETFIKNIWEQVLIQVEQPSQLIFTLPIRAFNLYQSWILSLEKSLSLPPIKLVDESTAAALGYGINQGEKVVLVADFGANLLELNLIRTVEAKRGQKHLQAEVLATTETYIGGLDLDTSIAQDFLKQLNLSRGKVQGRSWENLLETVEKLKINLSTTTETQETWLDLENDLSYSLTLSQERLTTILAEDGCLSQAQQAIKELLTLALNQGINQSHIDWVLLVGGSCAIPAVQQVFISQFGQDKVKLDNPLEVVAQGGIKFGQESGLEESLQHSYAIRLWDTLSQNYFYYFLFEKGSPYPTPQPKSLTLQASRDGQENIILDIGEVREISSVEVTYNSQGQITSNPLLQQREFRPLQVKNQSLCLPLFPPGQTGVDRLNLSIEILHSQILRLTVRDLLTQQTLFNQVELIVNPNQSRLEGAVLESPSSGMIHVGVLGGLVGKKRQLGIEDLTPTTPTPQPSSINWESLTCRYHLKGHNQGVTCVAIAQNREILVSGSQDQTLRLWNLTDGKCRGILTGHKGAVTTLAISPDDKLVASGSSDKTFNFWHLGTGQWLRTFLDHHASVFSVAFSPDGQWFASAGWEAGIMLRNLSLKTAPLYLRGHSGGVSAIAFSRDNQFLISCGDNTIKLWRLETGELLYTFVGHTDIILSLAPSPNGQLLASSGGMSDRTVKLWHLETGEFLQTLSGNHSDILSLAFSPDGQFLVGGGYKMIYFWDLNTGNLLYSIAAHEREINSVALSSDGQVLVSGSSDGTVKVFSFEPI